MNNEIERKTRRYNEYYFRDKKGFELMKVDKRYLVRDVLRLQQENNQLKEQRQHLKSWLMLLIEDTKKIVKSMDIFDNYDYETIHEMETRKSTFEFVLNELNELEGKSE